MSSSLKPWHVRAERMAFDNRPWLAVRAQEIETGNGHRMDCFCLLDYPDWVNVVALTEDRQVVLNLEYRHGIGRIIEELPSGMVEPGEDPGKTALRELEEETGYVFNEIELLSEYSPNPANHTNWVRGYLAIGGRKEMEQRLDASEELEQKLVNLDVFADMVRRGALVNAMHQATAWAALSRLRELGFVK